MTQRCIVHTHSSRLRRQQRKIAHPRSVYKTGSSPATKAQRIVKMVIARDVLHPDCTRADQMIAVVCAVREREKRVREREKKERRGARRLEGLDGSRGAGGRRLCNGLLGLLILVVIFELLWGIDNLDDKRATGATSDILAILQRLSTGSQARRAETRTKYLSRNLEAVPARTGKVVGLHLGVILEVLDFHLIVVRHGPGAVWVRVS